MILKLFTKNEDISAEGATSLFLHRKSELALSVATQLNSVLLCAVSAT